jgi:hypothetical protein
VAVDFIVGVRESKSVTFLNESLPMKKAVFCQKRRSKDMPASSSPVTPSPAAIKRLPWMRRLSFISPRLSRLLTLFSYDSLCLWAYVESQSAVTRFCEYPGYVIVDGRRLLATFYVEGAKHRQFLVLQDDIELVPEHPQRVSALARRWSFSRARSNFTATPSACSRHRFASNCAFCSRHRFAP